MVKLISLQVSSQQLAATWQQQNLQRPSSACLVALEIRLREVRKYQHHQEDITNSSHLLIRLAPPQGQQQQQPPSLVQNPYLR